MPVEFNDHTDIDINLLSDYLIPKYNPIREQVSKENPTWDNLRIRDRATAILGERENCKIVQVKDECGLLWVARYPSEQAKLAATLKHL